MLENQTIKEVRTARRKISEQHGHDLVRLVDHYKKLQRANLNAKPGNTLPRVWLRRRRVEQSLPRLGRRVAGG